MYGGLFNGLWGGVSNTLGLTLGLGAAEISELTGSADKKREQELALAKIAEQDKIRQETNKKLYIVLGIVGAVAILLFLIKTRKENA